MTAYNVYRARKVEREHPPTGQFITVDGVRLHYLEKGEGPPVVLLHGNVVTAEDFDTSGVLGLLAKRHRVIAFDRPGFGYSDRPHNGSAWSARAQADLLRDALVIARHQPSCCPWPFLGRSRRVGTGTEPPDRGKRAGSVVRLLLSNLSGGRSVVLTTRDTPPRGFAAVFDIAAPWQIDAATAAQGNVRASPCASPLREGLYLKMSVRPGQIRAESQDGVAMIPGAFAMRHRYQELTIPVVIMAGTKDRVVSAKQPARLHAQIPHSVLRMVPDVGHMLHYAVPEEVVEAVVEAGSSAKMRRDAQPPSARAA